jgi:hypothetical protein
MLTQERFLEKKIKIKENKKMHVPYIFYSFFPHSKMHLVMSNFIN